MLCSLSRVPLRSSKMSVVRRASTKHMPAYAMTGARLTCHTTHVNFSVDLNGCKCSFAD